MSPISRVARLVALVLLAGLLPSPAQAAAPPEPYRVATGLEGAYSADHVAIGDRIFWVTAGNSLTSSQDSDLWTSDGTSQGTHEFVDPNPGGSARVLGLHAFGDGFVFLADDGVHGREAWYSDGTAAGTAMIADLSLGADQSTGLLGVGPNVVFLSADDGEHGSEVHRWSGPGSVPQLLDVNTTARSIDDEDFRDQWSSAWTDANPIALGMVGDTLIFSVEHRIRTITADDGGHRYIAEWGTGREPWRAGPTGPAALVKDITTRDTFGDYDPRLSTRFPSDVGTAVLGNSVYFLTEGTDTNTARPELWRSDGTAAGTSQVAAPPVAYLSGEGGDGWDFEPVVAGGRIFYAAWDGGWDGLWATTGSGAGSRVSPPGEARLGAALGSGVVFTLSQAGSGREPWYSGGTSSTSLGDLRAGTAGSNPFPMSTWKGHTYFGANGGTGRDLYRTDGTAAGTERVMDLPNVAGSVIDGPVVFYGAANTLYFVNSPDDERDTDSELWVFDPARQVQRTSTTVLRAPAVIAHGAGGTATVTVSGSGGVPTGRVTIRDGANVLATVTLVNGKASFALPKGLTVGTHVLTASYSGDSVFRSSSSTPVKVQVKARTKLTGRVPDLTFERSEKIRIAVRLTTTPTIRATGRLTLLVDGKRKITANLTAGHGNKLTLVARGLSVGKHRLQVSFTDSPNAMDAKTGVVKIKVVR